jgi:hypothetical protein
VHSPTNTTTRTNTSWTTRHRDERECLQSGSCQSQDPFSGVRLLLERSKKHHAPSCAPCTGDADSRFHMGPADRSKQHHETKKNFPYLFSGTSMLQIAIRVIVGRCETQGHHVESDSTVAHSRPDPPLPLLHRSRALSNQPRGRLRALAADLKWVHFSLSA